MDGCPTENVFLDLLEGRLSEVERVPLRSHLRTCVACCAAFAALSESQLSATGHPRSRGDSGDDMGLADTSAGQERRSRGGSRDRQPRGRGGSLDRLDPARPPAQVAEFRILGPLGHGAMGYVYLAEDTKLARRVAIKFIGLPVDDAHAHACFLREARAIARLAHPNVVTIHQVGEVDGVPFLVSELVQGQSLDKLPRPLPWRRALALGLGLARGLRAAHRNGVLHRDIKPANAMLCAGEDGEQVKLLDFGLAKLADDVGGSALESRSGTIVGTPRYLAPEGWSGSANITAASDVFSLGVLLYELVAGVPPHAEQSLPALWHAVCNRDAPALAPLVQGLDPTFASIIERCLRRDPSERYATAVELCQTLEELAAAAALGQAERSSRARGPTLSRWAWRGLASVGLVGLLLGGAVLGRQLLARRTSGAALETAMVALPGGEFVMGSSAQEVDEAVAFCKEWHEESCPRADFAGEQPRRTVRLRDFRIDRTEVTNAAFAVWLRRQPDLRVATDGEVWQGSTLLLSAQPVIGFGLVQEGGRFAVKPGLERWPITQVTWDGASRYCAAQGTRLPTEAEWEYAARGKNRRSFPWGEEWPRCDQVVFARRERMACGHAGRQPASVGQAAQDRTPEGVQDLAGNVAEWVADLYVAPQPSCDGICEDPVVRAPAGDGAGPVNAALRVVRGGHWGDAASVRAAMRAPQPQDQALNNVGFRCATQESQRR